MVGQDWELVANKTGATRLGFALLLKFFELEARFPRVPEEVPPAAITYVAGQVGVPVEAFASYSWAPTARSIKAHRVQIRQAFGFREWAVPDEAEMAGWLAGEVCPVELRDEELRDALLVRCRSLGIEPPALTRLERVVGAARRSSRRSSASGRYSGWVRRARSGSASWSTRAARTAGVCWPS